MMHWFVLVLVGVGLASDAAIEKNARNGGSRQPLQTSKCNDVPSHPFDLILCRPTSNSITASVLCYEDAKGFIAYGTQSGKLVAKTPEQTFRKGEPTEAVLSPLQPNTHYFYRLHLTKTKSEEFTFHTARPPGSSFTFTITADPHLDEHTDPALYQRTLANALADTPDFHIDLGDTFMTEKHENRDAALKQYLAQRYYFGQLCQSAPLFLVLGNHDGESQRGRGGDANSLAVWSNTMRKRYFPNPIPNNFYAGNPTQHADAGFLQDYYSWQWGDALFIVLDPFWFTQKHHGKGDNWNSSLGEEQYRWLQHTLESSKAKFQFVFIHHLVGGADGQNRGGAEAAPFYEWGGINADLSDGFKHNRPGWPLPIHQLLVKNRVTIVFHGHDHLYAKQDLDGIVYQEVPQPGDSRGNTRSAEEYGYKSGVILGSSGHIRVTVSPNQIAADYVSANISRDKNGNRTNRQVLQSYFIPDNRKADTQTDSSEKNVDNLSQNEKLSQDSKKLKKSKNGRSVNTVLPDVDALTKLSLVLGRPTDKSITANVLSADALEVYLECGLKSREYTKKTGKIFLNPGKPTEIFLDQLLPDKQYFYRLRSQKPGDKSFLEGEESTFHTQRAPGSAFTFEIQGDSHPERPHEHDPALYAQMLRSVAADRPDFYLTIGDDFSVDTLRTVNAEAIDKIYLNQRCFLGLLAQSTPIFLVNGNHEQAAACNLDNTPDNVAVLAQTARNRYFPQPAPDNFYTGDTQSVEFIGKLRDYYAWTWGDALFVVIDPYWHSTSPVDNVFGGEKKPHRDLWEVTLGDDQYQWLKQTLQASKAKFKFVFAHHVLGTGRGGIEEADLFEWGGKNKKRIWQFEQKRPAWELPIHPLMAKYDVTIFFQGHDHIFARQELDGVIYQTLPEPADPNYNLFNKDAYRSGDVLPNSGRVRVNVAPNNVTVQYVRSWLPKDATEQHKDGEVAYHYSIPAVPSKPHSDSR